MSGQKPGDNGASSENVSLIVLVFRDKPARPRVDQRLPGGDGLVGCFGTEQPERQSRSRKK
jgi:hypothetical protein